MKLNSEVLNKKISKYQNRTLFWTIIQHSTTKSIIVGYPGIGKSTAAGDYFNLIDLESSYFSKTDPLWVDEYYSLAFDLYKQGFKVCVSGHNVDKLYRIMDEQGEEDIGKKIIVAIPDVKLKDEWMRMAKERFEEDKSIKNLKALQRIEKCFEEDIERIKEICKKREIILCEIEGL